MVHPNFALQMGPSLHINNFTHCIVLYAFAIIGAGVSEPPPPPLSVVYSQPACLHARACMVHIPQIVYLPISTPDARRECNIFVWPTTLVPSYRISNGAVKKIPQCGRRQRTLERRWVRYRERRAMETEEEIEGAKAADGARTAKAQTIG